MINTQSIAKFAESNIYVQRYLEENTDPFKRKYSKAFYVNRYDSDPNYQIDLATHMRNTNFFWAHRTIHERFKEVFTSTWNTPTINVHSVEIYGMQIPVDIYASLSITGKVSIRMEITKTTTFYFAGMKNEHGYSVRTAYFYPKSIMWTAEAIGKYVADILKAKLPGNGIFSTFMLQGNDMEDLKRAVKARAELLHGNDDDEIDLLNYFKKRYKVEIGWNVTTAQFIRYCRSLKGPFKEKTVVEKYDFSQFDNFDGDVDEIESEYWNSFEENTIYI